MSQEQSRSRFPLRYTRLTAGHGRSVLLRPEYADYVRERWNCGFGMTLICASLSQGLAYAATSSLCERVVTIVTFVTAL